MALTYLVPSDTAPIAQRWVNSALNMGLLLSRYLPREVIFKEDVAGERNQQWRDRWLRETCGRFQRNNSTLRELVESRYNRWQKTTNGSKRFSGRLLSRLIVGLGGKGPLEVGITLDRVTGLPYIPGSALKGVSRSMYLYLIAEAVGVPALAPEQYAKWKEKDRQKDRPTPLELLDEYLAAEDKERTAKLRQALHDIDQNPDHVFENLKHNAQEVNTFRLIFGSNAESGAVVFHHAVVKELPANGSLFELDVMTPHFKDYYDAANAGRTKLPAPSDDQSPNPVSFVTVAAGTVFSFAISLRRPSSSSDPTESEKALKMAYTLLRHSIDAWGVGAKTAAGYGYFITAGEQSPT